MLKNETIKLWGSIYSLQDLELIEADLFQQIDRIIDNTDLDDYFDKMDSVKFITELEQELNDIHEARRAYLMTYHD